MFRRVLITAANIALLCAAVITGFYYYGKVTTSAPLWLISVGMALEYVPAIIVVNVANGVWKRIQERKSFRGYLVVAVHILVILQALLAVSNVGQQEIMSKLGPYAVLLFAVNMGNLLWMSREKKEETVPEGEE